MAAFDAKAYDEQVVKPLRKHPGRLPDDLLTRYAIDLRMTDAQVRQRLVAVRSHWNKGASSTAKRSLASVYNRFLRADEELRRKHGDSMGAAEWWRAQDQKRSASQQGEIDELADTLYRNFGDLGLITPAQLDTMRAAYATLDPRELHKAVSIAGLRMVTPVELPSVSGLQGTLYARLSSLLDDAELLSIAELVHEGITQFQVMGPFSTEPPSAGGLTEEAVRAALERAQRRTGNQAVREALGLLATATRAGVDLRALTLFHLIDEIRQYHERGTLPSVLLRRLQQRGLHPDDARQVVVSVIAETRRTQRSGLALVQELLAEGRLVAARRALPTVTKPADAITAKELVAEQEEQVRQLVAAAALAVRAGAEADALRQLRQASVLASDDNQLAAELARVPPPPPLEVSAESEGAVVRVSWRVDASHQEGTRYRVVRRQDRPAFDPLDGATVAEVTATVAVDEQAPAARLVSYAVFASFDGDTWSRPASATVEHWPPVYDVRLTGMRSSTGQGVIEAQWQVHPDVVAVEVRRAEGARTPTHSDPHLRTTLTTSFRDTDLAEDVGYAYSLTAYYLNPDGTRASARPVLAHTNGTRAPRPVPALRLTPVANAAALLVEITWRDLPDAEVTIRRATAPCPWDYGETVPRTALVDYGTEVTGNRRVDAGWRTLVAEVPAGTFHYVPFSVEGANAVPGQDVVVGLTPGVNQLDYRRFGDEISLSWRWPDLAGIADVSWSGRNGSARRRLTRQQYEDAGGYRISCGFGPVFVEVRAVLLTEDGECYSAASTLDVPEAAPRVRYTVRRRSLPLFGGGTVSIRLSCEEPVPACTLLLVAAPGHVMPRRPEDGHVLLRSPLDLRPGTDIELSADLPKVRRPYWLRCFVTEGESIALVDPPTKQLKVS